LLTLNPFVTVLDDEEPFETNVRYRTVGDMTCTGAVESTAGDRRRDHRPKTAVVSAHRARRHPCR